VHTHDFVEFFWISDGRGTHWINDRLITIETGDLVFIREADRHEFSSDAEGMVVTNIAFPTPHLERLADRYPELRERYWSDAADLPCGLRLTPALRAQLEQATRDLVDRRHAVRALDAFLLRLLEGLETQAPPAQALPDWLEAALLAVRRPAHFRLGAAELARLCGRSHEHVARVMRALTGQSPSELITELRMAHAARRLALSDEEILAIAMDCGYQSLGQFYAAFNRQFGTTPARYRSQQTVVF
jgi:AraC family cel operon transcriptional repressor